MKYYNLKVTDLETGKTEQSIIGSPQNQDITELIKKAFNKCLVEVSLVPEYNIDINKTFFYRDN